MDDRLGRRLGPKFDDYCFPMDDRLGSRLRLTFDDDSDPTWMTTVFRWMPVIDCAADWAADSDPRLPVGPYFDDYCFPMDDRLGR